ncbi:hypothetical protein [Maribacter algarum]|uniref:hypothetical protein n=1 Tax=Maribacter algarum (ex Zhang et al. 2020) TaxID=2578118 RepID=UPI001486F447|nr:hypothetical protein [Maribacter algarum]
MKKNQKRNKLPEWCNKWFKSQNPYGNLYFHRLGGNDFKENNHRLAGNWQIIQRLLKE